MGGSVGGKDLQRYSYIIRIRVQVGVGVGVMTGRLTVSLKVGGKDLQRFDMYEFLRMEVSGNRTRGRLDPG